MVIIFLIYHLQSKQNIIPVLLKFNIFYIFPTFIIVLAHLVCLFLMWKTIVVHCGKYDVENRILFHSFIGGRTLGFVSPGQTGELLKGMFFKSDDRMAGASFSMIYSSYNLLVRTVIGSIALIYFIYTIPNSIKINLDNVMNLVIVGIFIIVIIILFKNNLKYLIRKFFWGKIISLMEIFIFHLKNQSLFWFFYILTLAVIANLLAAGAFLEVLIGFGVRIDILKGFMAFEAAYLAMSLLPITPGGIGLREISRIYFFSLLGCSEIKILCASFILYFISIIIPAVMGIYSLKYFLKK